MCASQFSVIPKKEKKLYVLMNNENLIDWSFQILGEKKMNLRPKNKIKTEQNDLF